MDEATFRRRLEEDGYPEPVVLDLAGDTFFEDHSHKFSSFALVVEGEFTVKTADATTACRAGECFSLAAGIVHSSWAGGDGAKILTGRRVAPE